MSNLRKINRQYLDDFDENKNFYKILYRPGYAVQTRELNQQQAILQNQVKKFGEHIFKDGTIVLGGSFDNQDNIDFVRASIPANQVIWFKGAEIRGVVSEVRAQIVHIEPNGANQILYIRYKKAGNSYEYFQQGEEIRTVGGEIEYSGTVLTEPNTIGTGSVFSISEGTVFYNGYFINFPAQTVVTGKFDVANNIQVVFKCEFVTITPNEDESLFDNAQGYPNFNAPGADRLSASLDLQVFDLDTELDESYIPLFNIKDTNIVEDKERTQYSRIAEELAKRTNDESGDYVVKGMTVFTREHLDTGSNGGRFTIDNGGDSSLISVGVERGLAYVKGFEIKTGETKYIDIPKSTHFKTVNNQISTVRGSNFFLVNQITGLPEANVYNEIELYDTAEQRKVNGISYVASPSGSKIGTAIVRTITSEEENGVQQLRVYVMNVTIDPGYEVEDVKAIKSDRFFGDIVVRQDGTVLRSPVSQSLLISTGESATKSITGESGQSDTSFSFTRLTDTTTNQSGEFTITTSGTSETFPYGVGTLFSLTKSRIVVSALQDFEVSAPGTISCSGNTVTGVGTNFTTQFNVGERIKLDSNGAYYTIDSITSDTELEIVETATFTDEAFLKYFINGDTINMSGYGINGSREIVSSTNSLYFDIKESLTAGANVSVSYDVAINEATQKTKLLRPNRYVKIDIDSLASFRSINLGFCDVHQIKSIRWSDSPFASESDGKDVTQSYILKNGQQDLYYDHAYIVAKSSSYTTGYLLVKLDYFEWSTSSGIGYFSVDSYPINDENPSESEIMTINIPKLTSEATGNVYNLRNFLDFRPRKMNTANDAVQVTDATTNPQKTSLFATSSVDVSPTPGYQVTYDYSYYVPRKDIVYLDDEGNFGSIQGTPAPWPYFPSVPSNVMGVCKVVIPPYPSIAGTHARSLGMESKGVQATRITHKRYTMRDIGRLDSRIKRLEYYNAVSLLEKSASDMQILDENGLDRFKNGFFVDGYMDHSLGQQQHPDYNIAVDRSRQLIRPVFEMQAFKFKLGLGNHSQENQDFITLPWTETSLIEQNRVSTYRNIEQGVFRYIGKMEVDPPIDTWVDETTIDKTIQRGDLEDDFGITQPEGTSTDWRTWSSSNTSTSTSVNGGSGSWSAYDRKYGDRAEKITSTDVLIGEYGSYQEAVNAARNHDRRTKVVGGGTETVTRTTTENTYRQRVDTTVNVDRETEEIGNFVTDVSIIPYIRPQKIKVTVKGLKANTRYHIWFDDENMNDYFTQYDVVENDETISTPPPNVEVDENDGVEADAYEDNDDDNQTTNSSSSSQQKYKSYTFNRNSRSGFRSNFWSRWRGVAKYIGSSLFSQGSFNSSSSSSSSSSSTNNDGGLTKTVTYSDPVNKVYPSTLEVDDNIVMGDEGAPIKSNEYGEVFGYLRIPQEGKKFRIGTKKIRITDSPTNSKGATSYAEANFVASGLNTKKQNTILSTITDASVDTSYGSKELIDSKQTSSTTTTKRRQNVKILGPSCTAYSFLVDVPEEEKGVFLTSVDVFIQSLHPELGVWFEIREMSNDGGITRNQVPYSEVWMYRDDPRLKTSEDASKATNVNFKNPVFLYNNTQYAFVIHTEGLNPDTYFFFSRLGEEDLNTGEQITGRQLTGTTYITNNNLNWDIVPDVDLTVRFNRAKFDNSQDGEFDFEIDDYELIKTDSLADYVIGQGERVISSLIIDASNVNGNGQFAAGDTITSNSTGITANVIKVEGNKIFTDAFRLEQGETATLDGKSTIFTIANLDRGAARVLKMNRVTNKLILDDSNGKFFKDCVIRTEEDVDFPLVEFYDFPYHLINFNAGTLPLTDVNAEFSLKTVLESNRNQVVSELDLGEGVDHEFERLMVIDSRSVENRDHNSRKSVILKATFGSASEYVSPVFDVSTMSATFVQNIINDDITDEHLPFGGELINKYISKTIILDEGQTSEDFKSYLSVYRPPNSEVYVWARFKNNQDPESIGVKEWVQLDVLSSGYSSTSNDDDFIEFECNIPDSLKTGPYGEYQYTDVNGHVHIGYDVFEVKVGLGGTDKVHVPMVSDLRSIAVMV